MHNFSVVRIAFIVISSLAILGAVQAEEEYPAAYFKPYIVYQAPEIAEQAAAESSSTVADVAVAAEAEEQAADPYPAADFKPEIVYQDQEQIAALDQGSASNESVGSAEPEKAEATPAEAAAFTPAAPVVISDEGGFPSSVLGMIAAVLAGMFWIMQKSDASSSYAAAAAPIEVAEAMQADSNEETVEEAGEEAGEEAMEASQESSS